MEIRSDERGKLIPTGMAGIRQQIKAVICRLFFCNRFKWVQSDYRFAPLNVHYRFSPLNACNRISATDYSLDITEREISGQVAGVQGGLNISGQV